MSLTQITQFHSPPQVALYNLACLDLATLYFFLFTVIILVFRRFVQIRDYFHKFTQGIVFEKALWEIVLSLSQCFQMFSFPRIYNF